MAHRALAAVDQALADVLDADVLHKVADLVIVHPGLHRPIISASERDAATGPLMTDMPATQGNTLVTKHACPLAQPHDAANGSGLNHMLGRATP